MKLRNANEWLTLIANFGVVIGLAMLVLELNYTTRLAETEAYVERTRAIGDHFTQLALSGDLTALARIIEPAGARGPRIKPILNQRCGRRVRHPGLDNEECPQHAEGPVGAGRSHAVAATAV